MVNPSEKFIIYFRAEDMAGNVTIVNSTGVVVDNKEPAGEQEAPQITIIPEASIGDGYYAGNVKVDIKVVDPIGMDDIDHNGHYSGLNTITYEIVADDINAKDGAPLLNNRTTVVENAVIDVDDDQLISAWSASITIDAKTFNSNEVVVKVTAVDNAGNERVSYTKVGNIKIDITKPIITVSYDNNSHDSDYTTYFNAPRTATITVKERNFNPDLVTLEILGEHFKGKNATIGEWKTTEDTTEGSNGDNTTHVLTVTFGEYDGKNVDDDYQWSVSCKDMAMNGNESDIRLGEQVTNPWAFTIDQTAPVVEITYDNMAVLNDMYYKAPRIATITVTEHNFDPDRVGITIAATNFGGEVALYRLVDEDGDGKIDWVQDQNNPDVWRAKVTFGEDDQNDAKYAFKVKVTDMAALDFETDNCEFYVDRVNPTLKIEGIVDGSANNAQVIGFVMTATDTNFDANNFVPELKILRKNSDEFETIELGQFSETTNGRKYTVTNLPDDDYGTYEGIYAIYCTLVDLAGNAYSQVLLVDEKGETYEEARCGADRLMSFSVNRKGSTFQLDAYTSSIVGKYYIDAVTQDLVITEVNVDSLESKVMLGDTTLVKGVHYEVAEIVDDNQWKTYTYTIKKEVFAADGDYTLTIYSKDQAGNDNYSENKKVFIRFEVDTVTPTITVSGLETNGRYQTDNQIVYLGLKANGGVLSNLVVNLVDERGNVLKEVLRMSGEELIAAAESESLTFTIQESDQLYQHVQIICTDSTGHVTEEVYRNVSVTTSGFMIFWANKPLRWGVIGGLSAALIAAAVVVVIKKRKRKEA